MSGDPDSEDVAGLRSRVEDIGTAQTGQREELVVIAADVLQLEQTTDDIQHSITQIERRAIDE